MVRTCLAVIIGTVLGAVATAGAQTNGQDRAMLRTISGYLERSNTGAYALRNVEWTIVSARPQTGISGAVGTSGAIDTTRLGAVSKLQIVGLLPPGEHRYARDGSSLLPFAGQRVEVTGVLHARYGIDGKPVLEMLDWTRQDWLPRGVESIRAVGPESTE
jgi:hypothetical protein